MSTFTNIRGGSIQYLLGTCMCIGIRRTWGYISADVMLVTRCLLLFSYLLDTNCKRVYYSLPDYLYQKHRQPCKEGNVWKKLNFSFDEIQRKVIITSNLWMGC